MLDMTDFVNGTQFEDLYFAECPFCDGQMVYTNESYVCYDCGRKGTVVDFLAEKNKTSRAVAAWQLSHDDYSDLFEVMQLAQEYYANRLSPCNPYLMQRGIDDDMIEKFGIGWADGNLAKYLRNCGVDDITMRKAGLLKATGYEYFYNRLMFPIRNRQGKTVGFGGRIVSNSNAPKYLNSPESRIFKKKEILFGIQNIDVTKPVYLVEGYMDAISLQAKGINAAAVLGTAVGMGHAYLLRSLGVKQIIMSLDGDEAGTVNAVKGIQALSDFFDVGVLCGYNDCKDPDEFINRYGPDAFAGLPIVPKNKFLLKMGISPIDILSDIVKSR